MTRPVSVPKGRFHRKSLRQALRRWDSSQALGEHPLATLRVVERRRNAAGYRPTILGRGVALRDVIQAAIHRLRPGTGPEDYYDRRWRPFLILQQQYLLGRSPDYLAEQLGIERSTYDHSQVEALEALASVLREWEQIGLPSDSELLPAGAAEAKRGVPFNAPPKAGHPLVERTEVLDDLRRRLTGQDSLRPIALTGIPGVGKTALAAELAHDTRLRETFRDGVLWAGLGSHPNLVGLLTLWAVALGLDLEELAEFHDLERKADAIHASIGRRRMLLVIDDVWRPEDGLALRIGGAACAHLFTTRFPRVAAELAGDGEVLPVRELGVESGIALLCRLAPALEAVDPEIVRRLVEAVGGLPLGLILIGGYLQRETMAGQHGRLDRALMHLGTAGSWLHLERVSSPLDRQPSLEGQAPLSLEKVIDLSVQSLDPKDQSALRAISYLPPKPNTISQDGILACADRPVSSIDSLVDHGLLETIGPLRYGLHRTIAEHMRQQPANKAAEDRLIQFYVSWIGTVRGDRPEVGLEVKNILAALQLARERGIHGAVAAGIDGFLPYLEMIGWVELAEELVASGEAAARASGEPRLLCRNLNHKGRLSQRRGDFQAAEKCFREMLHLASQNHDIEAQCAALTGLGVIALSRGDFTAAERDLQRALRLAERGRLWRLASGIQANLGSLALSRGSVEEAEQRMFAGLQLARELPDPPTIRALLANLGVASARRGDLEVAQERFQESLELARASGSRRDMAFLLANLGALASDRGEVESAWNCFHEAYDLAIALDDRVQQSHLMGNMGALALRRNDVATARDLIEGGLAIAQAIGHRECRVLLLVNRGALRGRTGDVEGAESDFKEAEEEARTAGLTRFTCAARIERAELALRRGALSEARASFNLARSQAREIGQKALEARAIFGLARVAAAEAIPQAAEDLAKESLAIFQELGSNRGQEIQRFLEENRYRSAR